MQYKPYRQKDGALLAIGVLCDKLKQTEPYKSELERMLVQHVFPEFSSPVGHLRAKVLCFTSDLICFLLSVKLYALTLRTKVYSSFVVKKDLRVSGVGPREPLKVAFLFSSEFFHKV